MKTTKEKRATFTPGPWKLVQERDYLNIQETETNLIVAQFCSVSEANARLIAFAPEMLEALRICLTELEDWNFTYEASEGQELARELLAKVEGEKEGIIL